MSQNVIEVNDAWVRFNLAMQKPMSAKEYFYALTHRELLFQEFFALRGVSLRMQAGESMGLVGRNGSGKSTLLKLITGILRPYRGTVRVDGRIAPLLELGAGFDGELTGRENITMNGLILGMSKRDIAAAFDDIVDFSGLKDFLDVPIKNYSSGMKARLGFAVATSAHPDILIADEVLSTGDKAFQARCEGRIEEMLSGGTTLLFVSHSAASVQRLCRKAAWINEGQIMVTGDTREVLAAYDESTAVPAKG